MDKITKILNDNYGILTKRKNRLQTDTTCGIKYTYRQICMGHRRLAVPVDKGMESEDIYY